MNILLYIEYNIVNICLNNKYLFHFFRSPNAESVVNIQNELLRKLGCTQFKYVRSNSFVHKIFIILKKLHKFIVKKY